MCIAVPGQVIGVDAAGATIESDGHLRRAATVLIPDVQVGEWVLVWAGTIVQRLEPDDARQIREALLTALQLGDMSDGDARAAPTAAPSGTPDLAR